MAAFLLPWCVPRIYAASTRWPAPLQDRSFFALLCGALPSGRAVDGVLVGAPLLRSLRRAGGARRQQLGWTGTRLVPSPGCPPWEKNGALVREDLVALYRRGLG